MARPKLSDAERQQNEKQREQEAERLRKLKEADPEAYKIEREKMRRDAFKRVAVRRTNAALRALDMVTPVANKNNYSYTQEEAAKILQALDAKFNEVVKAFEHTSRQREDTFQL